MSKISIFIILFATSVTLGILKYLDYTTPLLPNEEEKLGKRKMQKVQLYIDSVYPNPPGSNIPIVEPRMEWIKICNPRKLKSKPVNLVDWAIADREATWKFPGWDSWKYWEDREEWEEWLAKEYTINPGECYTITGEEYNASGSLKGVFLSNNGDEVILVSPWGEVVDLCQFGRVKEGKVVRCRKWWQKWWPF